MNTGTINLDQTQASTQIVRAARVIWIILAILALGVLVSALPGYVARITSGLPGHGPQVEPSGATSVLQAINSAASLVSALISLSLAGLLFRRKFENPAVAAVSFYMLLYGVVMTGPLEAWSWYWLGDLALAVNIQAILMSAPTVTLMVLFPNGRFVPPWTRWLLVASTGWALLSIALPIFPYQSNLMSLLILALAWMGLLVAGILAQVIRYRRFSTPGERQQTKWVLFGFAAWIGYLALSSFPYFYLNSLPAGSPSPWWASLSELGWWLSLNIVPVTLAIAITHSRLWNIDLVINRALVYGALTLTTIGLYILVVGGLGSLFQVGNSGLIAFLTTGLVAVLFQPLRARLQRSVNRLMYGERDDPVAVLTRLGEQVEGTGSPEDALSSIVATVARALKLPYAAIELGRQGEIAASYGIPRGEILRLPLSYQAEISGHLLVAPRSPGEGFSPADIMLLENISHQAGAAAHAARLTADLRLSRQRLVTAREEERRRLRRDLHDGLGPTLASLTLRMDAVRNLLRSDPHKAEQILGELKKQTQATIQNIRELVYELRPPVLDELGLAGALQSFIDSQTSSQLQITLDVSEPLPPLPAALEVAAYRIALEGLTNVLRHAGASRAVVRISLVKNQLVVEISDDGAGMPEAASAGVGLVSMQERADELGGSFQVSKAGRGTQVRACLPMLE
jgi:signal transduction histidine kinase